MSTDIRRKWSVPEDFTSAPGGQGKAWLALRKTFEAFRKRKGLVLLLFLIACALLFLGQTSPVLFRMEAGKGFDAFSVIGIVLMAVGILLEIGADWQKNEAKKKDAHMFVSTGLYSFVRCPNYLGELLLWTGVFISGLNIYHTVLEWGVALLGYIGIIYVMFSGARRLEIRQDKNYGHMPAYQTYVKTTPILLPFVPIYSVKKHTWLVA